MALRGVQHLSFHLSLQAILTLKKKRKTDPKAKIDSEREREREGGGGRILFVPLSLSLIGEGGGRCDSLIYRRQTHEFPE